MHPRDTLAQLRGWIDAADARAPAVSAWTIGMQVEHCCAAMTGICEALAASRPPPPRALPSAAGVLVLATRWIPRGRARAPAAAVPAGQPTREQLAARLDEADALLVRAAALDRGAWFRHFALGVLRRDRALRFLAIHNRHHLKIIADIAKAKG